MKAKHPSIEEELEKSANEIQGHINKLPLDQQEKFEGRLVASRNLIASVTGGKTVDEQELLALKGSFSRLLNDVKKIQN